MTHQFLILNFCTSAKASNQWRIIRCSSSSCSHLKQ